MTQTLSEKVITEALLQKVMRRTPLDEVGKQVEGGQHLSRTIGLFQLTMLGVGCTVGTGIFFVLTTEVPVAGPSIVFSFIAAAIVAGLTALCNAELPSSIPVSGSSYSYAYAYATLGEGVAMVVAACLLLEYGVSSAAVAVGWSQYVNQLLHNLFGFQIPDALAFSPEEGGIINVPAMVLVPLCMLLLIRGAKESAKANAVMVVIKLSVLLLFVVVGVTGWNTDNLADFAPFGVSGIWVATGGIFFSFIGLDAVSTAGEEVKDPQRTMPRAVALLAGLIPLSNLADLTSIGTLTAFSVVSAAVIILRHRAPDLPRGFRVPFYPWVPIASIVFSMLVVIGLPTITFVIFGLWVPAWLAFYFLYGIKHSRLGRLRDEDPWCDG
jgi:amino acid transporter